MALPHPHLYNVIHVDFAPDATLAPSPTFLSVVKEYDEKNWHSLLLKWVDAADIDIRENGDVYLAVSAYDLLRDMLENRPTEIGCFLPLVHNALGRFRREQRALTRRQEQAIEAAEEAAAKGLNAARYVSELLDIGDRAARSLLQRARERQSEAKMFLSCGNLHKVSRGKSALPSEAQIRRKMAHYRLTCPGKDWYPECEGHAYGDRLLCWPCYNRWGFEGERPEWLAYLIRDARKEAYRWAMDSLVTIQVSDDSEFDELLAA